MAGYIMTLDSMDSLQECIESGIYSTKLGEPDGKWRAYHEGTFADFLSMKAGDNIYFFIKRKIYGIGIIKNIQEDCKYLNYIGADRPIPYTDKEYKEGQPMLKNATVNNRCFCIFQPAPFFFKKGIDMDDALHSNPTAFKMLRVMWGVSFIKLDDIENKALTDIILKRNEENIFTGRETFVLNTDVLKNIENTISDSYRLTAKELLKSCVKNKLIQHEMAIEAALCELLLHNNEPPFGKWDYISHQVVASPLKAVQYMDKMDIFGYKFIPGYITKSKYIVIEIKKDVAIVEEGKTDAVEQIMKYVDWIQSEYAFGDYSMIEAYIVAGGFSQELIEKKNRECIRYYTKGYRPSLPCVWSTVKLIQYEYNMETGYLDFIEK